MSLPNDACKALENVLGAEYISDDPAMTQAYSYMWNVDIHCPQRCRPEAIVLPGSTEEVQDIIRIANRFKFQYIPTGTMLLATTIPTQANTIIIDPKRMNRIIEIDVKNMYAVIEPYVTYTQLHAEAIKRGLTIQTPGAGSQVSVLANQLFQGIAGTTHRHGYNRSILAAEWVLPGGEVLRLGSLGMSGSKWFWGDGPGINLKGLIRADCGHCGGLGMVTKIAVKLHPWSGPRTFPCAGTSPLLEAEFPPERFKMYWIRFPNYEKLIDAMYEIGKAEIGYALHKWPSIAFPILATNSKEDLWRELQSGYFQKEATCLIGVLLVGHSSERELVYEEKVLKEIIKETGGEFAPDKVYEMGKVISGDLIRFGFSTRLFRSAGTFFEVGLSIDSLDHSLKYGRVAEEAKKEYLETGEILGGDAEASDWINSFDFAHYSECESVFAMEVNRQIAKRIGEYIVKTLKYNLRDNIHPGFVEGELHDIAGPAELNYHKILRKIKNLLDPNNLSNPPYPIPAKTNSE